MKQAFDYFGQAIKEVARLKRTKTYGELFLVSATTEDFRTSEYEVQPFSYQALDAVKASGGQVLEVV